MFVHFFLRNLGRDTGLYYEVGHGRMRIDTDLMKNASRRLVRIVSIHQNVYYPI